MAHLENRHDRDLSEQTKFETVSQGCVRFVPSLEVLLARWAEGCDRNPHTTARHILEASGYTFRFAGGEHCAVGFQCPACEAEQAAERGEEPTPACFLVGGDYRPDGANPKSLGCRACRRVSKPSFLVEHLYASKPKRRAFLEQHCAGARPREERWVAARHDGKVAVADSAEAAMDAVADQFPKEAELCLCFGIEKPNVAELEKLPFVTVPLSDRGEVTVLSWHGERVTPNERALHEKWERRAKEIRQREIERRTRLVRAELERETPL